MNYAESLNYLLSLGHEVLASKLGLDDVRTLIEELGRPDRRYPSVLIAGTNGKGSAAAFVESILRSAGHRAGLYTSPHLVHLEERIRVAGIEISEVDFARLATTVRVVSESLVQSGKLERVPTFFEQVTAIALTHFAEVGVTVAVLEVGLGGRLDATNVVDPLVSVVTAIDLDHQRVLGDDISTIAGEKAGIIKPGTLAVIGRQEHVEAGEVLMRRCLETSVLPVFANPPQNVTPGDMGRMTFDYESTRSLYSRLMPGLRGRHQADNAASAVETAELLAGAGISIPRSAVVRGIREVRWPGRLELRDDSPLVLLDGAHNPSGARALRSYLLEFHPVPITLVFAAMADKDIQGMASELFDIARTVVLTKPNDTRAADTEQLARHGGEDSRKVVLTETAREAVSWARSLTPPQGLICVAGSLHLVGEVKKLIEEEDRQTSPSGQQSA